MNAYYQLAKPGIIYGNLFTAIAGYLLACQLRVGIISLIGTILGYGMVIGGAGVFNNLYDRDIDCLMERTKGRPSVTGTILFDRGLGYGFLLVASGLLTLLVLTNLLTSLLALIGLVVYFPIYTWLKRYSPWATLVGALAGAVPIMGGYIAYSDRLSPVVLILGLMMLAWQMTHFYAIALYREEDYRQALVPVLPIVRGVLRTWGSMVAFNIVFLIASLYLVKYLSHAGVYLIIMAVSSGIWLAFNIVGLFKRQLLWARQSFVMSLILVIVMSASLAFAT